MAWDKGFNFRGTVGYVADGANETYIVGDSYPTTRNTVTFGWIGGLGTFADRSAANDRRLAGINYNNATSVFQVDLIAAGAFTVHLGLGDQAGGGNAGCAVVVKDSGSTLATVNFNANVGNVFTDATGAVLNNTTWPAGEVGAALTFATTTLTLTFTSPGYWTMAHLFVSQGGVAPPTVTYPQLERGIRGLARGVAGGIARSFVRKDRIFVPSYATYDLQAAA